MKRSLLIFFLALVGLSISLAQVRLSAKYNYPTLPGTSQDSVLNGLKSIRAVNYASDVDGDGRSEIVATSYSLNGRVCVFEAAGNDSLRLVWVSPRIGSAAFGDSPRYATFGDLDNDGRKEVIYHLSETGYVIFEWDGVIGSDNYGTSFSQVVASPVFSFFRTRYNEYFEVLDIDGDGLNELVTAYDAYLGGSTNADDKYYVIRAIGEWSTGDPGFSSFEVEYALGRSDPGTSAYGLAGGTPMSMISANFDGTGNKELLFHNWNRKNVVPVRVTGANTYVLPDTTTGRQNYYLGGPDDDMSFFGALAYDIDGDGREEVYMPTYPASGSSNIGYVHMISYNSGQSTATIDSTNVTRLSVVGFAGTTFGYGYGDINNNGKNELYFSSAYPSNVIALEFQGGDKRNPANWVPRFVYTGDSTIYTAITNRDSLGIRDTIRIVDPSFASKIYGRNTDFDGDGREDIILPYQALSDSVTMRNLTWNVGLSKFDTVLTTVVNPKRWGLRVIEYDPTLGVEGKDLTIITPEDYKLEQNYPNPFNPTTTISFTLPIKDKISLKVFDVLGREVRTLINNEERPAGTDKVVWDGKNNQGLPVVSGAYFYTLQFGNFSKTNKMLLLK